MMILLLGSKNITKPNKQKVLPHLFWLKKTKTVQVSRQDVRFNLLLEHIFPKYDIYTFVYLSNMQLQFYYPISQTRRLRPSSKQFAQDCMGKEGVCQIFWYDILSCTVATRPLSRLEKGLGCMVQLRSGDMVSMPFFFLMLYISTPMLLSADNAITCNLRNSSPALFRNNQKILLLISFWKNLYKLKVLL